MKVIQKILMLALAVFMLGCGVKKNELSDYVNPFIGTDGHGHTYPGATAPSGMVQLSPDTRTVNWDACSGYHSSDNTIMGFSHTHLSGTGAIDYGDILLMPTIGEIQMQVGDESNTSSGYRSSFTHESEKAKAGYYAVTLDDYNIDVELTATERVGVHKYTFNKGSIGNVIVDLKHDVGENLVLGSGIEFNSANEISGYRQSQGWANNQHVYFVAQFSKPIMEYGIVANDEMISEQTTADGENIKAWLKFDLSNDKELVVKVGLSAVSIEGARKNLKAEVSGFDFDKVKDACAQKWNKVLSKINVKGENENDKVIFYTALYHSLVAPNLFSDVDGQYRGMDQKIHTADHPVYTVFSLWDTFRATHPLYTIINPHQATDFIKTMLLKYKESGYLPVWELAGCETGCMIGYHSVPVIADAFAKGMKDYDVELAYEAMKKSAMEDKLGLEHYKEMGYIPSDKEHEGVAKTLEYAYDDWCIAMVAKELGKEEDYAYFIQRSLGYQNMFDKETGFMRGKKNGKWVDPFDPYEVSGDYTEANAWQYSFFVPQDVNGLIEKLGGDELFSKKLDDLFNAEANVTGRSQPDISGLIGQYAHGNEPSHHMAYLYSFVGQPWKTQEITYRAMKELYTTERDGLCGNEDCGQMSSWYNMSAMGFYPVTPGLDYYVFGTPIFAEAEIAIDGGNSFNIKANNVSDVNKYIQSVMLNGEAYTKSYIKHAAIMNGGNLVFEMGPEPNKAFGAAIEDRPQANLDKGAYVLTPVLASGKKIFRGSTNVSFVQEEGIAIHYTLDGTAPSAASPVYSEPFEFFQTTHVKAIGIDAAGNESLLLVADFYGIPVEMNIEIVNEYAHVYACGGDLALIDQVRGNTDFRSNWQGYQGTDMEAIVDLGKVKSINSISLGALQEQRIWIFLPSEVEFYVSNDNKNFKLVGTASHDYELNKDGAFIHEFEKQLKGIKSRYVKVIAKTIGKCPEWHYGAGGDSWVFVDEIVIK